MIFTAYVLTMTLVNGDYVNTHFPVESAARNDAILALSALNPEHFDSVLIRRVSFYEDGAMDAEPCVSCRGSHHDMIKVLANQVEYSQKLVFFVNEYCEGKHFDSCINTPCCYSSSHGCIHPKHPKNGDEIS